jgi:hypothetical protein
MTIWQYGVAGIINYWDGGMHAAMPHRNIRIVWETKGNRKH